MVCETRTLLSDPYLGRAETDWARITAMSLLGYGLTFAGHLEDALFVQEAVLCMKQRLGVSEQRILVVQTNLAITYGELGHLEKAVSMERDVYSALLKLQGEEHPKTLRAANNYASSLNGLRRFEEAKTLLRRTLPVARRVLGENHDLMLMMRWVYARALYKDPDATLDDLREAVTTLEDTERTARLVLGGAHPEAVGIEKCLRRARAALHASETQSS